MWYNTVTGFGNEDMHMFGRALILPAMLLYFALQTHHRDMLAQRSNEGTTWARPQREPGRGKAAGDRDSGFPPTPHPQVVVTDAWTTSKQKTSLPSSLAPIQRKINVCHLLRVKGSSGSGGRPSKPCSCNCCNNVATHRCPKVNLNMVKWFTLAAPGKGPLYWVLKSTFYDSMMHERDKK